MPLKDYIWCIGRCQLYKIDYNGKLLEQHQLEEWMYHACIDRLGKFIYAVSDTTLHCIDLSNFKTVWKFKNGYKQWVEKSYIIYDALSIAYDDTRVFCTFDYYHQYDGIICFDAKTGKELWRKDDFDQQPIGYNNLLFLTNSVKDSEKMSIKLYIFDNISGKELKSFGPFEGIDKQSISVALNRIFISHSNLLDWRTKTYRSFIKCFNLK
jgi:outer membrane protein assembly factor BamB